MDGAVGTHRDYAQERADLQEGHEEYKQLVNEQIDEVCNDTTFSNQQKIAGLKILKQELLKNEADYQAQLAQINQDEYQHYIDEYGEDALIQGSTVSNDNMYCTFAGPSPENSNPTEQSTENAYCPFADETMNQSAENGLKIQEDYDNTY